MIEASPVAQHRPGDPRQLAASATTTTLGCARASSRRTHSPGAVAFAAIVGDVTFSDQAKQVEDHHPGPSSVSTSHARLQASRRYDPFQIPAFWIHPSSLAQRRRVKGLTLPGVTPNRGWRGQDLVDAADFIFGDYDVALGGKATPPLPWMDNGFYLVFRRLNQNVDGF